MRTVPCAAIASSIGVPIENFSAAGKSEGIARVAKVVKTDAEWRYDSKTKYESGTGWPSFWQPISSFNVVKSSDSTFGMQRDAISCRRCDAHLGHVFDDGPRPTGLRY